MKKIGIIFAMKEELDALLTHLTLSREYQIFDLTFYECRLGKNQLTLVESGIGKVNAARCAQMLIDHAEVECIFNIGVAGSLSEKVGICDIVLGEKLVQHDFDLTAFQYEKGSIPNIGLYVPSDSSLLKLAREIQTENKVHKGVIASGDIFCSDEKMSSEIASNFQALCVEMEGASIAQVCYLCHVPFLVIRSISDSVQNGDNKLTYEEFLEVSSKSVADYVIKILEKI